MVIDTWGPEETRAFGKKMGQEARKRENRQEPEEGGNYGF